MTSNRLWAGITCGVALGIGAVAVVGATTPSADAASTFTVTPQQLQINQNISSAAVLRSNRALNYLAPIRTTQTDNADTGNNGVKPLNSIPGSGQGWTVGQLAPGQKQFWANVAANGALTSSSGPTSGTGVFAASSTATGVYVVQLQDQRLVLLLDRHAQLPDLGAVPAPRGDRGRREPADPGERERLQPGRRSSGPGRRRLQRAGALLDHPSRRACAIPLKKGRRRAEPREGWAPRTGPPARRAGGLDR